MSEQEQNTQAEPSRTSENEGTGETPAGGTANPPATPAATTEQPTATEPVTLAQHVDAKVGEVDAQIASMQAKKDDLLATAQSAPEAIRRLQINQASAIDGAISELNAKKSGFIAALESIPAELHALEARALAALKYLF